MKAIYVRVSTEEQAQKGYSIESQIALCKEKAKTDEVLEYIDDGFSGEFLDRPALSRLREDLKAGLIDEVICYDPDRLSRKLMNQLIISEEIEKHAKLTFVNHDYQKTPEGMLFYQMRGAIAEYEKAKINERMSSGRRRKALQGKVVRNPFMYGYDYNKEEGKLEINEKEAEIVRLIFDLFTRPNDKVQGINGIANYLTEMKIPTKKGKSIWHRQVVRQILKNEAYVGRFYHNRWDTEGILGNKYRDSDEKVTMKERPRDEWILVPCPQIIDEDVFNHAQKLLSESRRRWAKRSRRKYLLSGLLRCGECGNTLTGRRSKNWGKYVYEYIDIKSTAGAKNQGCGMRIRVEELDEQVWEKVKDWLNNPDEIAAASEEAENINYDTFEIERLEKEIRTTQEGRKRLLSLFAQGLDISNEEMRESIRELKEKEEELKEKLNEIKARIKDDQSNEYSKKLFKEASEFYLNKGEDELSFEDKQKIIRTVVREIIVYKDKIDIYTF